MKLIDIIPNGNKIVEDSNQLFIASEDFFYKGLPILKDSLVYYDGTTIKVNILPSTVLSSSNMGLSKLKGQIREDDDGNLIINRESECPLEETEIQTGGVVFWHKNHFDSAGVFPKYFNARLRNNEPEIDYGGIVFSSIFYEFRIQDGVLLQFINTKPLEISLNDFIITIPENIEILKNNESYTLVPTEGIEYKGVYFDAGESLKLDSDGVLEGKTGKPFKAEAQNLNNNSIMTLELPRIYIYISPEGFLKARLYDSESQSRSFYQLRKL